METLRDELVRVALAWEAAFGNAPHITTVISKYDAATIKACCLDEYKACMEGITSVQKGHDFTFNGKEYQVKANRPSGKPRSKVTLVPKASNYDWEYLIWILYDKAYVVQEAWEWERDAYIRAFDQLKRLSPDDMRLGKNLLRD